MLFLSLIIPSTALAYSYSSSARSFSVPRRSFSTYRAPVSSFTHTPTYRPTYTPTVRTIATPVRSQPSTIVTPAQVDAGIRTMGISNVARQASTVSNTSWNPFNGNFFLWYMLFGGANRINQNNSTTTNATK